MKTRWVLPLVCVCAILVVASFAARLVTRSDAEARIARASVVQATHRATVAEAYAAAIVPQVLTLTAQRDSAIKSAGTHQRAASTLTSKLAVLAVAAPDTCKTIIITADSALAQKDSAIADLDTALVRSKASEAKLQSAVDTLVPALTLLRVSSTALVKADTKLSRRQLIVRLLPRPGFGAAVGFDATGTPRLTYGITLGWSF